MVGPKVVVYGLCTEGYDLACTMVLKGAQVHVVDESNQSAMLLTQDIAKTYPNISSIKDDEMILPLVPIKEAVSKAQYIFFSPRIRKAGQDLYIRTEIHLNSKEQLQKLQKIRSIVYCIPAGIGGNNDTLEHIQDSCPKDLVAKILEQKADLNRESLNELVKEKKATVGKGYLQDKGALYLIATDLGISLGEPSNDGISIKDIFSGAKDVSLETRVLNVAKPRQFSRKDGSEFLLRTMTVYDNGGTVSVKLWDEKANLPGIENLKPGDLVRIVKAYVKSDLSGAPTINIGSGSSIEPSDSQSDIRGIDSMSVDVGTIKQHEDKDLVVTGAVDGPIGTINFTNSKGQPGKGLKMRLKGNDESFMRVVVWGQDETNLPPVISHGSVAKLIGVRTKESNQGGLELHGNEGTAIHVDGSHDVQPITARIISVSKTNKTNDNYCAK